MNYYVCECGLRLRSDHRNRHEKRNLHLKRMGLPYDWRNSPTKKQPQTQTNGV